LLSDEGFGARQVSQILGVSRDTVQRWRKRWVDSKHKNVKERLEDAPRPGAPVTYTPEQICAIVALACELPIESGRPITHWTQEELANEVIKRGIVKYILSAGTSLTFLMRLVVGCRNTKRLFLFFGFKIIH